jgi:hypothetical protein
VFPRPGWGARVREFEVVDLGMVIVLVVVIGRIKADTVYR